MRFVALFMVILTSACTTVKLDSVANYCAEVDDAAQCNGSKTLESSKVTNKSILLFADNQAALVPTQPIFEQSRLAEDTVNTAHRRPALDQFSLDIMSYILDESDEARLVIHGGDLLNNSCKAEFEEVAERLQNVDWFAAPGNHDGYLLGITSPLPVSKWFWPKPDLSFNGLLDERASWATVCVPAEKLKGDKDVGFIEPSNYRHYQSYVVDKTHFNTLYLKAIGIHSEMPIETSPAKTADYAPTENQSGFQISCIDFGDDPHRKFLKNVCWSANESELVKDPQSDKWPAFNKFLCKQDKCDEYAQWSNIKPWRNFVVQLLSIDIPDSKGNKRPLDILILDTSSYTKKEGINEKHGWANFRSLGAADRGHISEEQQMLVNGWLENRSNDLLVIGHHPLADFDETSYAFVEKLFNTSGALSYISGDTHDGFDRSHRVEGSTNDRSVSEVNLGALIDAPIEYAYFGFNKADELVTERISLTSLKDKLDNHKYPKNYASRDGFLNTCHEEWTWNEHSPPHDPLSAPKKTEDGQPVDEEVDCNQMGTCQPQKWLGIPYLLNPFSIREVRLRSLTSYKLERLAHLQEVMLQLHKHAGNELSAETQAKIVASNTQVEALREGLFWKYGRRYQPGSNPFNQTLISMNQTIDALVEEESNILLSQRERARKFKLCSALYEAEREYRK